MEAFWLTLEASAPARALRASFIAYPLVNALHIASLGAVVTSVVMLDIRTLGGLNTLGREPFIRVMQRTALASFTVAATSGLALFTVQASEYAANPAFLAKMALLALAGLNFLLLARAGHGAGEAVATKIAAALSLLLWPAILVAGRFIGFLG